MEKLIAQVGGLILRQYRGCSAASLRGDPQRVQPTCQFWVWVGVSGFTNLFHSAETRAPNLTPGSELIPISINQENRSSGWVETCKNYYLTKKQQMGFELSWELNQNNNKRVLSLQIWVLNKQQGSGPNSVGSGGNQLPNWWVKHKYEFDTSLTRVLTRVEHSWVNKRFLDSWIDWY